MIYDQLRGEPMNPEQNLTAARIGLNTNVVARESSPLQQAMMTLEDEIDRLFHAIEGHHHAISATLGPESGEAVLNDPGNPLAPCSELVQAVITQAGRVRDVRQAVLQLTERVEV